MPVNTNSDRLGFRPAGAQRVDSHIPHSKPSLGLPRSRKSYAEPHRPSPAVTPVQARTTRPVESNLHVMKEYTIRVTNLAPDVNLEDIAASLQHLHDGAFVSSMTRNGAAVNVTLTSAVEPLIRLVDAGALLTSVPASSSPSPVPSPAFRTPDPQPHPGMPGPQGVGLTPAGIPSSAWAAETSDLMAELSAKDEEVSRLTAANEELQRTVLDVQLAAAEREVEIRVAAQAAADEQFSALRNDLEALRSAHEGQLQSLAEAHRAREEELQAEWQEATHKAVVAARADLSATFVENARRRDEETSSRIAESQQHNAAIAMAELYAQSQVVFERMQCDSVLLLQKVESGLQEIDARNRMDASQMNSHHEEGLLQLRSEATAKLRLSEFLRCETDDALRITADEATERTALLTFLLRSFLQSIRSITQGQANFLESRMAELADKLEANKLEHKANLRVCQQAAEEALEKELQYAAEKHRQELLLLQEAHSRLHTALEKEKQASAQIAAHSNRTFSELSRALSSIDATVETKLQLFSNASLAELSRCDANAAERAAMFRSTIDSLDQQLVETREEVARLQARCHEAELAAATAHSQAAAQIKDHENLSRDVRAHAAQESEAIRSEYEHALEKLRLEHRSEMESIARKNAEREAAVRELHTAGIAQMQRAHAEELNEMRARESRLISEHLAKQRQMEHEFRETVDAQRRDAEVALRSLRSDIHSLGRPGGDDHLDHSYRERPSNAGSTHSGRRHSTGLREGSVKIPSRPSSTARAGTERESDGVTPPVTAMLSFGDMLYTAAGSVIKCWNQTGKCVQVFHGHTGVINDMAIFEGCLYSAGNDRSVIQWPPVDPLDMSGDAAAPFHTFKLTASSSRLAVSSRCLFLVHNDKSIKEVRRDGVVVRLLRGHTAAITVLKPISLPSSLSYELLSGDAAGVIRTWSESSSSSSRTSAEVGNGSVRSTGLLANGDIYVVTQGGTVAILNRQLQPQMQFQTTQPVDCGIPFRSSLACASSLRSCVTVHDLRQNGAEVSVWDPEGDAAGSDVPIVMEVLGNFLVVARGGKVRFFPLPGIA